LIRLLGRRGRAVCTLALAMSIPAAGCSQSAPAAERASLDASALFAQACAKCHAADGTGGLPMVATGPRPVDLTDVEWQRSRSDAELVTAIRSGRGAMPPFQDVLTAEQINALGAYVRTLRRP
jgi:mono/diheme cytochrome c family protein